MQLPEQFRTTSFRLAIGYAVLFVVSVLVIMGTTYLAATSEMRGIVRSSISEDMAAFRMAIRDGGAQGLEAAVQERSENAPDDRFFLLLGPDGKRLEGNLSPQLWKAGIADRRLGDGDVEASADLKLAASQNPDNEVRLLSLGETMGGYSVLSGRNAHILDETQEIILSALLWGCLATTLMALVGGYIVSIGPSRRVDEIAATTRQIVSGRLDLRLPVSGRRDELDRLAGDINGMLAKIEVLMSSLKQVSTDIAHDLRTPLARLRQRLESVRRQPRVTAEYELAIDGAIEETDATIETFNALLRISQIEAGARKARFEPIDLSVLLEKLADVYTEVAADEGHRFDCAITPAIHVFGDGELLTQMVANVLENAINHCPGSVRIAMALDDEKGIAVLSIADNGPGIPLDERDKVFRRLYRLDRSRTTPGSGLGLSMVAAIAELHGARVEALDNNPGLLMRITFETLANSDPREMRMDYQSV